MEPNRAITVVKAVISILVTLGVCNGQEYSYSNFNSLKGGNKNWIYRWKPPDHIRQYVPWHIMGFDREGRVVFLSELGKFRLREFVENHPNDLEDFLHHYEQGLQLFADFALRPNKFPNGTEYGPQGCAFIGDFEGFDVRDLTSAKSMSLMLEILSKIPLTDPYLAYGFFLNLNSLARVLLNPTVRSILPDGIKKMLEKILVFGSDKKNYTRAILRRISRDQLPPQLGGFSNFTFIAPFGQAFNLHLN